MSNGQRRIGRYEIVREVGGGGMAVVYLARQPDLNRSVALKELSAFHAADAALVGRFLHEAHLAGSLSHPNIVTVYEYFEHEAIALTVRTHTASAFPEARPPRTNEPDAAARTERCRLGSRPQRTLHEDVGVDHHRRGVRTGARRRSPNPTVAFLRVAAHHTGPGRTPIEKTKGGTS
jgi:Protein kinase domain